MKVYFEGSFWSHRSRDHAGKEIPVNKEFLWDKICCFVPSVYSCAKGLVIDFLARVPAEEIRAFMDKWNLSVDNDSCKNFTREQQMKLDADNPLELELRLEAAVNGKTLKADHSSSTCWNPCVPRGICATAGEEDVIQHYGLNPEFGWGIHRFYFRWATRRHPEIKSLSLTLKQNLISVPGPHFQATDPGDSFTFVCPETGESHTLTVQEIEPQEMKKEHLTFQGQEFPTHYTFMSYTIDPELPDGVLTLEDCAESDAPRGEKNLGASSIAIIGGSSGPAGIILGKENKLRVACSSLHFEPVEQVEWRLVFHERRKEDLTVELYV